MPYYHICSTCGATLDPGEKCDCYPHEALMADVLTLTPDERRMLGVSNPTAGNIIETFCQMGILQDCTPQKSRNKLYAFAEYLDILERGTEVV